MQAHCKRRLSMRLRTLHSKGCEESQNAFAPNKNSRLATPAPMPRLYCMRPHNLGGSKRIHGTNRPAIMCHKRLCIDITYHLIARRRHRRYLQPHALVVFSPDVKLVPQERAWALSEMLSKGGRSRPLPILLALRTLGELVFHGAHYQRMR